MSHKSYLAALLSGAIWFAGSAIAAQQTFTTDSTARAGASDSALLLSQIDALQQELRELRGQFEVQGNDLSVLRQQQQAFNKRMNEFAGADEDVVDSVKDELEKQDTAVPASPVLDDDEQKEMPLDEQSSYQWAYELIRQQDFDAATLAMQRFLRDYPEGTYVANARYWLGELYLAQSQPEQAIEQFNVVLDQYDQSNKVAPSMLKIGFAYHEKNDLVQAREYLQQVRTLFPNSGEAYLAAGRLEMIARETASES
ncbi:MAG: tol-pal system protein YbgF [Gammaproteobacteria bacterium]